MKMTTVHLSWRNPFHTTLLKGVHSGQDVLANMLSVKNVNVKMKNAKLANSKRQRTMSTLGGCKMKLGAEGMKVMIIYK